MNHLRRATIVALFMPLVPLVMVGCGDQNPAPIRPKNFIDESVTAFRSVATLGVSGHAVTLDVWVREPERKLRHPGGFVVRTIDEGSPFAGKLAVGDVVYRVGEEDVPNVADPTVGLVELIEGAAHEEGPVELGVLRRGRPTSTSATLDLAPLDDGLPGLTARFAGMADAGLDALAHMQQADGSFKTAEEDAGARLLVAAIAGLAFLSSGEGLGDGTRAMNVRLCMEAARRELADANSAGHPIALAYALTFFAEFIDRSSNLELMKDVSSCVAPLLRCQREDGGFAMRDPAETLGYSDTTLATNVALFALGVAERAGLSTQGDTVERACVFLKEKTNDGHVTFVTATGFDRRTEAGRSAGAATALRALNCEGADPFFTELVAYHRPLANEIVDAPRGRLFHLLSSALLSKQGGEGSWLSFHHAQKHRFVAWQRADGSFDPPRSRTPYEFEGAADGDALATAILTTILLLPAEELPLSLATKLHPMQPRRDGDGKVVEISGPVGGPKPPPDAKTMQFGSLEEAREFLESMGVDPDQLEGNVKLGGKKPKKDG